MEKKAKDVMKFWQGDPGWIYSQSIDEPGVKMSFYLQMVHTVDFTETQRGNFSINYVRLFDKDRNQTGHYFAPVQNGWEDDEDETQPAVELVYENDGVLCKFQTFEEAVDAIEELLKEVYELAVAMSDKEAKA